jgi:Mce-associated membrane protein
VIRLIARRRDDKDASEVDAPVMSSEGEESELAVGIEESGEASATRDDVVATAAPRPERMAWRRSLVFGLLPVLVMLLAGVVGYLKWQKAVQSETQTARAESVHAATESTIKILSYNPDTVDRDLDAARDRLTGTFRDAYTQLTHDVVIPGAKQKKITAVATVPAAASVSASPNRAVVMVFVNQTMMMGNDAPSSTATTVKVTMDRNKNRWLISDFTPI